MLGCYKAQYNLFWFIVRIIGIDPGLVNTGWAILEKTGNHIKLIDSGTIKTSSKDKLEYRLNLIHSTLNNIINSYQPTFMSIEETYVNKNPQTSLLLGHARGTIILLAGQFNLELSTLSPRKIKSLFSGYGGADKLQMQKMLKIFLPNAQFKTNDEADAIAIAYAAII
jgi:crossover junction endodeoxyribonuclease RuvC